MATKFSDSLHFPTLAGQPLPAAGGASLEAAFLKTIFAEIAGGPTQHGRGASTDAGDRRAAGEEMNALPSSASVATSKGGTG